MNWRNFNIIVGSSVIIGVIVGVLAYLFGTVLLWVTEFRMDHFSYLIPFLPVVGVLIIWLYQHFGEVAKGGMGLLFDLEQEEREDLPISLVPLIITTTWLTHLFGGSAGREGVAVQMGGTIGANIWKKIGKEQMDNKLFMMMGMAAGFGGLFQTPVAASIFAIEIFVVGKLYWQYLLPVLSSSLIACGVTRLLGLEKFSFLLEKKYLDSLTIVMCLKYIVLIILVGMAGKLFASSLSKMKNWLTVRFSNVYIRIFFVSIILVIGLWGLGNGRYSGLGTNLISFAFSNEEIFLWDWLFKLFFTVITIAASFQGGEVTPLFAIGACLGVVLAQCLGLPIFLCAALGYVGVFASATNAYMASFFLSLEVFGWHYWYLFLLLTILLFFMNQEGTIYGKQLFHERLSRYTVKRFWK